MASDLKLSRIVGPVRFAYLKAFRPEVNRNTGEEQYSVLLLVPKQANEFHEELHMDPQEPIKAIIDAIKEVAADKFGQKVKYLIPFKNGDVETNDAGDAKFPGYWFMNAASKAQYPPVLIDCNTDPVKGGWGSGCWGRAKLTFYAYDNKNRGVNARLDGLQFLYEGEPLGSSFDPQAVANEFGAVTGTHVTARPAATTTDEYGEAPAKEDDPFLD